MTDDSTDATDATWVETMPAVYDRCLGPAIFAPYAKHVAGLVSALAPESVLELAAGTGILTAQLTAALPKAHITATDLNTAMVAWAMERVPAATWRVADAQALDFPDHFFDVVACQFGVMFFPDKPAAFAHAARVLKPTGTLLFTVWDTVETSDLPSALVESLRAVFPDNAPDFVVRIPHGYHDRDAIALDLANGGMVLDRIDRVVLRGAPATASTIAEGFCFGSPLRFELQERGDLPELASAVAAEMTSRLGAAPVEGALAAFVITAHPAGRT